MRYTGQPLEEGDVLQRFLRGRFTEPEQAADLLEQAFRAARLDPPAGLSPVYRDDVLPEFGALALGCVGLPWVQKLAEALAELAYLRGELPAAPPPERSPARPPLGPAARPARPARPVLGAAS
ncbi:hypothetical protein HUT16_28155 [Kitasatospora sp. NA04385]|uniref:hypothetical protein n=1 Tax=Kitasatospora sp. NA04385 TaxID=2742135 RepID=UPI001592AE4D|nr:hypothetical protein [Kitasatospora sp. NA04385]QKW22434.1 hypothetical protein HUT16_28155 [Kitasatospora sp. NA04385]